MRHLDLFSGIGGFALAAKWASIQTILFVEKNEFCQKVLLKNFPDVGIFTDIKKFNATHQKVDILTGGFPCQPFSVAGKRKGYSDERHLWPDMLRIIKQCRPEFIIAENVPGLVPMLDAILNDLEEANYSCQAYLIPASLIGAPHKRERLWIVAHRNSERSDNRVDNREAGQVCENLQRHVEKVQQEWSQLISDSWATLNTRDWFQYNRKLCRRDNGLPHRMDRIKSLGNSIVPQIAYIFLKAIVLYKTTNSLAIGS